MLAQNPVWGRGSELGMPASAGCGAANGREEVRVSERLELRPTAEGSGSGPHSAGVLVFRLGYGRRYE
ncbi:MAG: hypothetical protein JXR84_04365 [Anaerolineae bacterium]|nr:hypothetical protein [Anaerolineae bacterium]